MVGEEKKGAKRLPARRPRRLRSAAPTSTPDAPTMSEGPYTALSPLRPEPPSAPAMRARPV